MSNPKSDDGRGYDRDAWVNWVTNLDKSASQRQLSERTGVSPASMSRYFDGSQRPSADATVKIARAFGVSPLPGLRFAGWLELSDVDHMRVSLALRAASDDELAEEVLRRMKDGGEHASLSRPVTDVR